MDRALALRELGLEQLVRGARALFNSQDILFLILDVSLGAGLPLDGLLDR